MKNIIIIFLTLFGFLNEVQASMWPNNLEGTYLCDSVETDINKHYKGQMSLKKTGETYDVHMNFDDGFILCWHRYLRPNQASFFPGFY